MPLTSPDRAVAVGGRPAPKGRSDRARAARPEDDFSEAPLVLDLTQAAALARGDRQREWLLLLLSPGVGLEPAAWPISTSRDRRLEQFVGALGRAGYRIEERPVGHRGRPRRLLVSHSDAYGTAFSLAGALRQRWRPGQEDWPVDQLLQILTVDQQRVAAALATDQQCGLSASQIVEAAQGLA